MAEFDPVGWLHEQGFQLDIHTAKMVNALAAEARRRAMEEAAALCRKERDLIENSGAHTRAGTRLNELFACEECATAIERAKGEG